MSHSLIRFIKCWFPRSVTRIFWIILSVIWLVLLYGCSAHANEALSNQDIVVHHSLPDHAQYSGNNEMIYDPSQIGVGFVRPEDRNTPLDQLPQTDEFHITDGQPFSVDLVLISGQEATFLITTLVDYKQVPFSLDGEPGLLHEIAVKPGKALYIPVQVGVDSEGVHDLIFAVFKNPNQRFSDPNFRSFDQCLFSGRRTVVIVGDDGKPASAKQPDVLGSNPPPGVDWGPPILFANSSNIHPSKPEGQLPFVVFEKTGGDFVYRIWMSNLGNTEQRPTNYALVQFLNFRQVELNDKDFLIVYLDANQEAIVSNHLILPDMVRMNELQMVYVMDPFKSLIHNEVAMPFVYGSPCLGIQTTNKK